MSSKPVCVMFLNADGTYDVSVEPGTELSALIAVLERLQKREEDGERPELGPPPVVIQGSSG